MGILFIRFILCQSIFVKRNVLNSPQILTIKYYLSVWLCIKLVLEIQKCLTSRRWCCSTSAACCLPTGMYVQVSDSGTDFLFQCDSSEMQEPPMKPLNFSEARKKLKSKGSTKNCLSINVRVNNDEYQAMRCEIKCLFLSFLKPGLNSVLLFRLSCF